MKTNKYLGPVGLTELINLIQADFQKKQDWMQFPEMPDPSLYTGKVVQYTGITDPLTYTKGYFYYSTGLEWVMVNTTSAVEICAVLPLWDEAKNGTLYYVTSESALYLKGNVRDEWLNVAGGDNKSFEIVAELPAWAAADPKLIYMVPADDGSTVTGYIKSGTAGKFYQLGGGSVKGFEIVTSLPGWSAADANTLYLVISGDKLTGYVKDINQPNHFYELGAEAEPAFEVVAALPTWASASEDKIYFLKDNGKLKGYIKDPDHNNTWFELAGAGGIEQVTTLPAWADADPEILYLVPDENDLLSAYKKDPDHTGKFFELSGNDAITMEDIEDIFDEVFGD
jgi:hypothetical protein